MELERSSRLGLRTLTCAVVLALTAITAGCTGDQALPSEPPESTSMSTEQKEALDRCQSAVDPPWVTAEKLEQWDSERTVVYLCGVVGGEWSVRVVAPAESQSGIRQPDLLDRFDPAGPIEGCFDADEGRRVLLTDLLEVYETSDIVCDTGSLVEG